ncbi:hypothetical protein SPRG_11425 [Saprolegnia parasitica CBS 223.65]|uniref:WDR5-like beta-propeller domain-containing protein n=1 Tax=Saprolegnia parasitica (strain CBS 223.65) TaxID=695850 RepID=A0A067BYY6_SAPPC|nr:hypothetical protein SPRG_11425 [Saprolegnia parasitica CBS 223.65]KDO23503.1 hypothetical protein SPRG_11425 [Saprolegnia parasitica CBS 223.65]|eukprot:XP_012205816.1 hypothetical protein SPRG_11425 [Saprolegnia parasitica CBS 223.65]
MATVDAVLPVTATKPSSSAGRAPYQVKFTCLGHKKAISSLEFSNFGNLLASASPDKTVKIWNASTGALEQTLAGHEQGISDISWSANARFIASASDDCTVKIWDTESSETVSTLRGHANYVFSVNFNPQGTLLASASFDESARLWDVRTGRTVRILPAHSDPVTASSFNRDGTLLVTSSYDGLCRIWDVASGQCLNTLTLSNELNDAIIPVSFAKFSPNGRFVLVSTLDGRLRLWDFARNRVIKTYSGHVNSSFCVFSTFSLHGGPPTIISGSEDNTIVLYDVQTQEKVQVLSGHTDAVLAVAAHPMKAMLASGALDKDKTIKVWEQVNPSCSS